MTKALFHLNGQVRCSPRVHEAEQNALTCASCGRLELDQGKLRDMPTPQELQQQARAKRDEVSRARRWASEMTTDADRDRLLRYAVELEAEAAELDRQAATPVTKVKPPVYSTTKPVEHVQQQQQQQQGPEALDDTEKSKD